jgi:hypothetical protein
MFPAIHIYTESLAKHSAEGTLPCIDTDVALSHHHSFALVFVGLLH